MKTSFKIFACVVSALASCAFVYGLFLASEQKIRHDNNFTRRFAHAPLGAQHDIDLGYNSFYFAGSANGRIFLGNTTAPLRVWEVDSALNIKAVHVIALDKSDLPFSAVQIRIAAPYFFVGDGTISAIYRGKLADWKAKLVFRKPVPFSYFAPLDSNRIAFRGMNRKAQNILGLIAAGSGTVAYRPNLLQEQIDGIFDTDGELIGDPLTKKAIYTYFYRNQFTIADSQMRLLARGNTIDTTSKAQLKVVYIPDRRERKLSAPPLIVNKAMATYADYLFVNSQLADRYQSDEVWKQSATVDVYDLADQSYRMSFYVYDAKGEKMKSFVVTGTHLFAICGNRLVAARLNKPISDLLQRKHP